MASVGIVEYEGGAGVGIAAAITLFAFSAVAVFDHIGGVAVRITNGFQNHGDNDKNTTLSSSLNTQV
ncbi:MAG: hypothetical protein AAFX01_00580 [Cyanobacteria bacterium J06638_28]